VGKKDEESGKRIVLAVQDDTDDEWPLFWKELEKAEDCLGSEWRFSDSVNAVVCSKCCLVFASASEFFVHLWEKH
jgi:hypothetical protein